MAFHAELPLVERTYIGANLVTIVARSIEVPEYEAPTSCRDELLAAMDFVVSSGHGEFRWTEIAAALRALGSRHTLGSSYTVFKHEVVGAEAFRVRKGYYRRAADLKGVPSKTSIQDEVMAAARAYVARTGRETFSFPDIWLEVQRRGTKFTQGAVRTTLSCHLAGGSPSREYEPQIDRVQRGVFKIRNAEDES